MDNKLFDALMARFIHDLLSPISTVSLALESAIEDIDPSTASFMQTGIEDFRNRIEIFKLLITTAENLEFNRVSELIIADAMKTDIQCSFTNFPQSMPGCSIRILANLYRLAKSAIMRHGIIKFTYTPENLFTLSISSKYQLTLAEKIKELHVQTNLDITTSNVDIMFSMSEIKRISGKECYVKTIDEKNAILTIQ